MVILIVGLAVTDGAISGFSISPGLYIIITSSASLPWLFCPLIKIIFSPFINATLVAVNLFPLKLKLLKKRPFTENVMLLLAVTFKILASKETYLYFDSDIWILGLVNDTIGLGLSLGL